MRTYYLIRLDDASPYMDAKKWQRMEDLLDRYGITPLVGIIPANADPETMDKEDPLFWEKAHRWVNKGWKMALHGYKHVCATYSGGLNPVHHRSEFAGLPYAEQRQIISNGYAILKEHNLEVEWFFAPSHTFDADPLRAIKDCTPIKYISDMIASAPFKYQGFSFVPCQLGVLRKMPISGYWCACYHPNYMNDKEFVTLENFLKRHAGDFLPFDEIPEAGKRSMKDRFLSFAYFLLRRVRG